MRPALFPIRLSSIRCGGISLFAAITISCSVFAQAETIYSSNGTGFYVNMQGYVLTAHHVIDDCRGDIALHSTMAVHKARIVASDEVRDLAILKTVQPVSVQGIGYLLADHTQVAIGDTVVAAGFPHSEESKNTFPKFVTNVGKVLDTRGYRMKNGDLPLFFSNITKQGYSGGPVLDKNGNVVGVTLAGTCFNEACRAGFDQAANAKFDSLEAKAARGAAMERYVDTNTGASLPVIKKFLRDNNVSYTESRSTKTYPEDHAQQMGYAIVNVRCPSSKEDQLRNSGIRTQ